MEDPETSLSQDNPTSPDSRETPLQNYLTSLNHPNSPFKNTESLRTIADKCLKEGINSATLWFRNFLKERNIQLRQLESKPPEIKGETAILPDGRMVIYAPKNFLTERNSLGQLTNLLHKYKSLLLRRDEIRTPQKVDQLLITDISFIQFLKTLPNVSQTQLDQSLKEYQRRLNLSPANQKAHLPTPSPIK